MVSAEDLAEFTVFDRLSDEQRATVATCAELVTFPDATRLFDEGELASGCWLIRTGLVALTTSIVAQGDVVIQTLGRGDPLGWSWLVPPHVWTFTATTVGTVSAFQLDTARLHAIADLDPALGYPLSLGLFAVLLSRLQSTRARLLDVYGSPRDR